MEKFLLQVKQTNWERSYMNNNSKKTKYTNLNIMLPFGCDFQH